MAGPPFGPVDEDHRLAIGRAEVIHDLAMSSKVLDADSNGWPMGAGRRSSGSSRPSSLVDASSTSSPAFEPEGSPATSLLCGVQCRLSNQPFNDRLFV